MNSPLVSVVMSIYNEPLDWIQLSIDSILNQTFKDFEFLIINDNPSRKELSIYLDKINQKDNRIKILTNEENIGLTKSLNIGLRNARGQYIARMDADDISYPSRFEKQVDFMESHPDIIVCGTKVKVFGKKAFLSYDTAFEKDEDIRGQMILNSGFAHPSVFIRKEILYKNNISYDENYKTAQDYKLWYDLRLYGKFANLKEKLLKYRCSTNQVSYVNKTNQNSNRDLIRGWFKKEYLSEIHSNDANKFRVTNNKQSSYALREQVFYNCTFKKLLRFWMNHNTAATIKEKIIITLRSLKQLTLK